MRLRPELKPSSASATDMYGFINVVIFLSLVAGYIGLSIITSW